MDNKTQSFQFRKTKLALAVAMTVSLAACGVDGDEGSTSTSNTNSTSQVDSNQNTVGNQTELKGDVTGVVTDTNGNPIAGAMVYLAGMETTTNAGGQYLFENVDVVAVNGVNNEGDETADQLSAALPVTIMAEGHLGGTVYVTPKAQVNNTGGQDNDSNGGTNSDTTVQTFIDGFTANAGTAELPALTAKVVAYLKDCRIDTDQDGNNEAPAVGVPVAFDVTDVLDNTKTTTSNGAGVGSDFILAVTSAFSAVSDADGMIEVMLPADSTARFLADGWVQDAAAPNNTSVLNADVTTENEGITTHLGDIVICPITTSSEGNAPKTDPQVVSVDGEYTTNSVEKVVNPGGAFNREFVVLSEGYVNNFKVNFNVPLVGLDGLESELVVTLNGSDAPSGTTIVLADDLMSATITFPADLDPEDKVDFFIPEWRATDADGERVGEDTAHEGKDFIDEGFDVGGGTKVSTYVRVSFCIFSVPDATAGIDLVEQIIDADTSEDASFAALSEYSDSFASDVDGTLVLEQLNGQPETATRLDALAEEILKTTNAGSGTEITVDVNDARVSYTGAAGTVTVNNGVGALGSASGVFEVANTADKTTVTATATNIFGVVKATDSVVVYDKIAPTTVLQQNYDITGAGAPKAALPMTTTSQTTGVTFGNGGEATAGQPFVAGSVGNPIIYVQPRHLVARGADLTTFTERGNEFDELTEDMNDRRDSGETTIDLREFADRPLYDRTAIASEWGAQAQQIGVAVSENISVVTGSTVGTADISTAISNPTAFNNVAINVDNVNVNDVDLVAITVADVVNLANNDIGGVVSFAGVIADTSDSANVAVAGRGDAGGNNAQVIFQDAFPPMVESAEWNGTTFTIVFNEGIVVPTGTDTLDMHLVDPLDATNATKATIQLDAGETNTAAEGYFTYNTANNTLVVNVSTGIETIFKGSTTADEELFYNDDIALNSTQEQHAVLNWDSVEDASGNSWVEFNGGALSNGIELGDTALAGNDRWEVNAPQFLAVNTLGQLNVNLDFDPTTYNKRLLGGIADSDDAVTLLLTSTYAIDLDATFSLAGFTNASMPSNGTARIISGTDIAALLQEGDFTINTGSSTGSVSPDRTTITFNIVVNGLLATDLIEAGDTVQIDNAVLNVANQATDTLSRDDAIQQLIFN